MSVVALLRTLGTIQDSHDFNRLALLLPIIYLSSSSRQSICIANSHSRTRSRREGYVVKDDGSTWET